MKRGDIVRLKRPLIPMIGSTQAFIFGQVVDVITEPLETAADSETAKPEIVELLIHLYAPEAGSFYRDEWGEVATFSIYPDEIIEVS